MEKLSARIGIPIKAQEIGAKIGVEIGVLRGEFSVSILNSAPDMFLYLVDAWSYQNDVVDMANISQEVSDSDYNIAIENLKPYEGRFEISRKFSHKAVLDFEDDFFDFIFIDADHSYSGCLSDLTLWFPKLKIGGIFSGHDYIPDIKKDAAGSEFGVKSALDKFLEDKNYELNITGEPQPYAYPSWWFIK